MTPSWPSRRRIEPRPTPRATVLSAQREALQVEIQIAKVEAKPGKAMVSLESAVVCQFNDRATG